MRSGAAVCTAFIGLALGAGAASAASFSFDTQERFVSLQDVARGTSALESAPDFADFSSVLGGGSAIQNSSLGATRVVGFVSHSIVARTQAQSGDVAEHFVVESSLETQFTLDEAADYTLETQFSLSPNTDVAEVFPAFDNQTLIEATLLGPAGSILSFSYDLRAECAFQETCSLDLPHAEAGVLAPGSYTLTLRSFAIVESNVICVGFGCSSQLPISTDSNVTASVDLRIVPEPGTAATLAAGLALLPALARRRRR